MSSGVPMNSQIVREVREAIEEMVGREMIEAVRAEGRRIQEMWSHMSSEEIANWITGEEA